MLAGSHHITISPPLLQKLSETPADPWAEGVELTGSAFTATEVAEGAKSWGAEEDARMVRDEKAWKKAFSESMGGKAEAKIVQAIRIFNEKQDGLEEIAQLLLKK